MASSALGPRVLLRRLREVMAERETAQKRLDKIVMLIAANVVAEVCSIYVMRQGQELELFATEGLKAEAVHKSRLHVGEGLVGTIAASAEALEPGRSARSSGVQIPAGNGRRDLPLLPRRADPARRHRDRRAGRPKPHASALHRGRRGSAADDGHGAGRSHCLGRTAGSRARRRRGRHAYQTPSFQRRSAGGRRGAWACGAARAAHRHHQSDCRKHSKGKVTARGGGPGASGACRRDGRRHGRARYGILRGARNLPHVRA